MRVAPLWLALAGCWSSGGGTIVAPAPPPPPGLPVVELVVVDDTAISFMHTSRHGLVETHTETVPDSVQDMQWLGADPVVLTISDNANATVWTITTTGHTAWPAPDPASWQVASHAGLDHFDPPRWELVTTRDRHAWLGRCEWGYDNDGAECTAWAYVQLGSTPNVIVYKVPEQAPSPYSLAITPPPNVRVELVDDPAWKPDPTVPRTRHIMQCRQNGRLHEYPPLAERFDGSGFYDVDHLIWLSSDPPMFRIDRSDVCMELCTKPVVFEGCNLSKRFDDTAFVEGPQNVFALRTDSHVSVRWQGRSLGEIDHAVNKLDFVPPR
jgi:hypothetical protein